MIKTIGFLFGLWIISNGLTLLYYTLKGVLAGFMKEGIRAIGWLVCSTFTGVAVIVLGVMVWILTAH